MASNENDAIIIEAEDLNFDDSFTVSQIDPLASGGKILQVRNDRKDAKATTTFNGPAGLYDLSLFAYDETDGKGEIKIWVNGEEISKTKLDQNRGFDFPNIITRFQITAGSLSLNPGDVIEIEAKRDKGETASLDKLVLEPVAFSTPAKIEIEAEDLLFDDGFVVSRVDSDASGGKILRVRPGEKEGNAATIFTGEAGTYNLVIDAYDENDGRGELKVWINGKEVGKQKLEQNLGSNLPTETTKVQVVIEDLVLKLGDVIRIRGKSDRSEYTSFDKITFEPVVNIPEVEIVSNGGDRTAVVNVDENTTTVTDFDVNIGDNNVTYRINDGADRDLFNIDANTGELTFKSAPDWETPLDTDGNNVYEVNVVAIGAESGDSQFVSVVVQDVDDTVPEDPVEIISNGGGNTAFITVDEGTTAVTDFEVNVDDSSVIYRINDGADRDFFEIDPQTGQLSFKSAPDFQQPLDAGGNNVYEVNVVAIGNNSGDGQFLSVRVNDIAPPEGPEATFNVVEGIRSVANIDISGSQAGASFRINAGADRDLFLINPETGVLSFKQVPDFENPIDRAEGSAIAGDNVYEVNVLATRGDQTESKFITVAVQDIDESTLPDPISVYLLAGQSNLVGEAQVANLTDTSYVQPFSDAQIWSRPQSTFVDLEPGFDGQTVELGPELSFGRQIVSNTGENVLLIKYGLGATSLAEDWQTDGSGTQFNQFTDIVNSALDSLTNQSLTYDIEGLVWMQGESDTYNDAFAESYEDNLLGFVDGVRDTYGENLDIAVGLIRNDLPTSARNRELVRDAQRVVSAGDSNVFLVDTDALGGSEVLRPGDTTHYNADGQILLGNAFADAFI